MSRTKSLDIEIVGQFMESVPVDVRGLSKALGILVEERRLPDDVSGKIERSTRSDESFIIIVNADHRDTRKRFTIAHEIAHFILHRDKIGNGVTDDGMYRSATLSTAIERQANQYAAEILMPWRLVIEDQAFKTRNVASLAERFKVSPQVAEIRMTELRPFG